MRTLRSIRLGWLGNFFLIIGGTAISFQALAFSDRQVDISDLGFWFKFLLSIGVAVAGWFLVKHDNKIEKLAEANLIKRLALQEHETKQLQQQLYMMREEMGKQYHTKDEVTDSFREVRNSLTALHRRLDEFQREVIISLRK